MNVPETKHAWTLLLRSEKPLLCLPKQATLDEEVSALALGNILKSLGKEPSIACERPLNKRSLGLLSEKNTFPILQSLSDMRTSWIEVPVTQTGIQEIWYENTKDVLKIHLVPKKGTWKPSDIHFTTSGSKYDTIITFGTTHTGQLSSLFDMQEDTLHTLPLINIDYRLENDGFGTVNVLSPAATSCSEVTTSLIQSAGDKPLTPETATLLLLGMMSATRGFQNPRTTPKTLEFASFLMNSGAKQETIADTLYRTKSVSFLKLLGNALTNLKHEPEYKLAHTTLKDIPENWSEQVLEENLQTCMDEVIGTSPDICVFVLFKQQGSETKIYILTKQPFRADEASQHLKGKSNSNWSTSFVKENLSHEIIQSALNPIRNYISGILRGV